MVKLKCFVDYFLRGFGFENWADLHRSCWHFDNRVYLFVTLKWSAVFGIVASFVEQITGMPPLVLIAFVGLVILEVNTGMRAARKRKEEIKSRKFGRMLLKVGYYVSLMSILFLLSSKKFPSIVGFEIDPFLLLYYIYLVGVVFQMVLSIMENFEDLGYKESKSLAGIILRHYNRIFKIEKDESRNTETPESD